MKETLFGSIVTALENAADKEGHKLNMDSVMISQDGEVFAHFFKKEKTANDLRSISKPILCMALGIAMERGLRFGGKRVTLDTLIWPFFEGRIKLTNTANGARLEKVKLRHLLNHTIGYEVGLLFSKDIKERDPETLLEYVFNFDILHEPGEYFMYSNVGPYIISALVQEELGVNLANWVNEMLFMPLGIVQYEWKNYGKYCAASSGLRLSHSDLHKIACLFVEEGQFKKEQLVPRNWLGLMRTPQVNTPTMYDEARVFPKYAYGYYLWICKNGTYYCDGTDGQYLIVLPKSGTVITTFGHQSDMKPITECFRPLL
jgi:CubicO group peptidase (beta-lactamase class C family)